MTITQDLKNMKGRTAADVARLDGWTSIMNSGSQSRSRYNTARPHQGIAQRVPDGEHDGGHLTVADLDRERIPPQTRPQRPDQRIHARRLRPRRLAGHQADPIFERDRSVALPG